MKIYLQPTDITCGSLQKDALRLPFQFRAVVMMKVSHVVILRKESYRVKRNENNFERS